MIYTRLCAGALIAVLAGCSSSDSPESGDGDGSLNDGSTDTTENDDQIAPHISFVNAGLLLREVVMIANDENFDTASDELEPLFDSVKILIDRAMDDGAASGNGLTFVSSAIVREGFSDYTFSCNNGGTLVAGAYDEDEVSGSFVEQLVAEGACSIGDAAYEGSANKRVRFVRGTDESTFENFEVSHADGDSLLLNGEYSDTSPEQRGPVVVTGWTDASLLVVDGGETTNIEDYTSSRRSITRNTIPGTEPAGTTAQVAFTVTAPWSSGNPLQVVVDLGYVDSGDTTVGDNGYPAQWQSGSIRVTATDGSGLTLLPDTGEVETFLVVIDGEPNSPLVFNWADGFQVLCATGFDCR